MNSVSPEEQRRRRIFVGKCQEVGGEGWEGWAPKDGAQVGLALKSLRGAFVGSLSLSSPHLSERR